MSETIKAIETEYNGYKFRSRLEARWAVFFDALGVKYEYEPEGYKLSNGEQYLPDFYLVDLDIYVEVKPCNAIFVSDKGFDEGAGKYEAFASDATKQGHCAWFVFGDPFDALMHTHGKGNNKLFSTCTCVYKTLSKNPEQKCHCCGEEHTVSECKIENVLCGGNVVALSENYALWYMQPSLKSENQQLFSICSNPPKEFVEDLTENFELNKSKIDLTDVCEQTTNAALKARQARFEHGEKPSV